MLKLLEFTYTIEYKKGKANRAADALFRIPTLFAITAVVPSWSEDIEKSYTQDATCTSLITQLTAGSTTLPKYSFQAGILRYKGRIYIGTYLKFQHTS